MKSIDIFYQGEGIREVDHIEVTDEHTFEAVKTAIIKKHGLQGEMLIFIEDCEEPIDEKEHAHKHAGHAGVKAHVHRCREVKTLVTFNGETVEHQFAPAATVAKVKQWAAEKKFKMTPAEAGEHVLQLVGSHVRPDAGTHLGALTSCPECRVVFDLVPNERVNGALWEGA